MAVKDIGLALRLVTSLPELVHLRAGYHSAGWVDRAVELTDPDHPLFPAAVGVAARAGWVLGEFSHARSLACLAQGRVRNPGTSYPAYPADVLADVALYEGDAASALTHYEGELVCARCATDPLRLVWILLHYALVDAGQEPPLSAAQVAGLGGGVGVALTGAEAVDLARTMLRRYS